nr:glutamate receptor 2.5-like [Aegilops tauschii subsp. strangulata]
MEWPAIPFLCFLMLGSSIAASPAPVRVGVVLDLTSDVGRKSLACISNALDDFNAAQYDNSGGAAPVELRVMDSRGDRTAAAHSAKVLIKNSQVQAIIWGPHTMTKADHVGHLGRQNHIPVLSFSGISPTSCAFWLDDLVPASIGDAKYGFTLGSETVTFRNPKTDRRESRKLYTRNSKKNCRGKTVLKIAVPRKEGFQFFVNVIDQISKEQNITGYSIDIFEAAMRNLHPIPCYRFIVFNGSYDELVGNVSLGVYDGAVGDVTITAERVTNADFTMPYTQSGVSMLVLAEDEPDIRWTFVEPLDGMLWLVTMVFFLYTGIVVWMTELPTHQEYQELSWRQCGTAIYFIFCTLTFSHGQSIRSPLTRIVVVIWCFVVLILVQSYTASLSSILTAKRLRPKVTNLDQLRHNGHFVGYQDDSFVRSFLINRNISESKLRNYTRKEEYADALRKGSKNGGVSAIVDEIPYLTSFLSDNRYKNDFKMLGCKYKTPGFGFAFRLGSPIVHNLSTAILNLAGGAKGEKIEEKWFGKTLPSVGADAVPNTDSAPLTVQHFSGLFIITGSISTLMLLISIVRLVYAKCTRSRKVGVESVSCNSAHEDPSLHNGVDDNPSPKQPLREDSDDVSQGVHGTGQNVGGADPESLQQINGMKGGSVPAGHIQIEMSNV